MFLLDDEVSKVIKFKLKKFNSEIEEKDLKLIEDFDLSNKFLSDKDKNIKLNFLNLMPNLKKISLQYFDIDNSIIDIFNSLSNLKVLELSFCNFEFTRKLINENLNSITINCCKIKDYSAICLTEKFHIIGDENLNLKKLENKFNVENLYLNNCKIKNFKYIENFKNLKKINLDGSIFDNKILENIDKKIEISNLNRYLPVG